MDPGCHGDDECCLPRASRILRGLCGEMFFAVFPCDRRCPLGSCAVRRAGCRGCAQFWPAAAREQGAVAITFLGHASFLVESPEGVRIITDYNGMIGAPVTPDIVTMNNAHPTHYTDVPDPDIKYVLRGWNPAGGIASHRLEYSD